MMISFCQKGRFAENQASFRENILYESSDVCKAARSGESTAGTRTKASDTLF